MIGLRHAPTPQILIENAADWMVEYVAWRDARQGSEPRRYSHDEIRETLRGETAGKCAYCEGFVGDVSFDHVEHILPKSRHPHLVCEWTNLTVACQRCNVNKGDFEDDTCALLNPYVDDPEAEISFGGPMALARGGARARMTISRLGLNRKDLVFSRTQVLQRISDLLALIERAEADLQAALWVDVDALVAGESEFASACRYFVRSQCEERQITRPPN